MIGAALVVGALIDDLNTDPELDGILVGGGAYDPGNTASLYEHEDWSSQVWHFDRVD